jgi:DNA polymerase-3 subunit alpha
MQTYLKELQPSKLEDLIAMNALYRPGPMDYIPSFIARKHGREKISYDIPDMERYLKDTYGITVYQEQVMLLSRSLANFTRGESDTLRKAMGKKMIDQMDKLKEKFISGGESNGYARQILEKIWRDWEKFASYAFNKSHATCYSWIAYQTAYLKANYQSEYMAAVLSRNRANIKDVTKAIDECRMLGIQVLGPDVNESVLKFGVNKKGDIRFGLAAIKGVGEGAAENIIEERKKGGPYKDIFDFVERISLFACNKKVIDSLALAGAFDNLNVTREPFVTPNEKGETFTEVIIRYGNKFQQDKTASSNSLFGDLGMVEITKPSIPACTKWSDLERLNKEKELIGFYLSAHPLDEFSIILNHVCNIGLGEINSDREKLKGKELLLGGIVTGTKEGILQRNGNPPYMIINMEDFTGSGEIPLFGNDYIKFSNYGRPGMYLLIRASIVPRQYNDTELELKVKSIQLLQDVKDSLIDKMNISMSINHLDEQILNEIAILVKNNPGKTQLYFQLRDGDHNLSLNMFSKSLRFKVTQRLIDFLNEKDDIVFSINK